MSFSIGVIIHNEERNIARLLEHFREDSLEPLGLDKVVVVSSASTDRSDQIVRELAARWPKLQLICEADRRGKAAAINLFLQAARPASILVVSSGDVLPERGAIARLLATFEDPAVGMAGGRPMPRGEAPGWIQRIVRLQWDLHHEVSLLSPKLGELVAFRNVVDRLPEDTAVDEASLEAILSTAGYRFLYVPEAIVWNKGPDTLEDFLKQRRRIAAGHRHLRDSSGYRVSTARGRLVAVALARLLAREPTRAGDAVAAAAIETYARLRGMWDLYVARKNPYIWDVAASTKDPADAPPGRDRGGAP